VGDEADFWRTWEAGFNGHLVKPIDYDIIAAQLARIFWAHALAPDGLPSLVTQRRHRVDSRRAARRQVAREQGDGGEH
jgi:hypothetical protein